MSDFRTNLDQGQQEKLDQVISELAKAQAAEIQSLSAKHEVGCVFFFGWGEGGGFFQAIFHANESQNLTAAKNYHWQCKILSWHTHVISAGLMELTKNL